MEIWDRKALAYAALQRLWTADNPETAEEGWQKQFAFLALPEEQRNPGHFYRHEGESGFIEYYPSGDRGQFHPQLPAGVDPASVIVIPKLSGIPTIYDQIKGLLLRTAGVAAGDAIPPAIQAILNDMDELRGPAHAQRIKFMITGDGAQAAHQGYAAVVNFLSAKLAQLCPEQLSLSRINGFEVAALMLLDSLARQLLVADPAPPPTLLPKMFDPTMVVSLPDLAFRFVQDCFRAGMAVPAMAALQKIRQGGDATLAKARAQVQGDLHPGLYMDSYYEGLQQAGIRFLAVRWGCQSALTYGKLADADRKILEKRLNTTEELLVRMETALMYAVKDLDGNRYRDWQNRIGEAQAAGDTKTVSAVLGNVFDSQMFYPVAVKEVMLKGISQKSSTPATGPIVADV